MINKTISGSGSESFVMTMFLTDALSKEEEEVRLFDFRSSTQSVESISNEIIVRILLQIRIA